MCGLCVNPIILRMLRALFRDIIISAKLSILITLTQKMHPPRKYSNDFHASSGGADCSKLKNLDYRRRC